MIQQIQRLLDDYTTWLRDKTTLRQIDDWVEVTTPYLDRHNDYMQIYAQRTGRGFLLTDDGYTIRDLEHSGCGLRTPKRQELLKMTLNGFGVHLDGDALTVHSSIEDFGLRKHNLVQSMLAVNDMFYLAVPLVSSLFLEDVVSWLDLHDIRYTPKVKFTGKTGYDHLFDFVVPKSRRQPERILQAINRPSRDNAQVVAFSWIDTKGVRPPDSRMYALLNDSDQSVSEAVVEALRSYDVRPVLWGARDEIREELTA